MNGHDVAPGVETAIIRKDKKKKSRDEMCVIYVWDRNMSGFVAAISSREIDRSEKKKKGLVAVYPSVASHLTSK